MNAEREAEVEAAVAAEAAEAAAEEEARANRRFAGWQRRQERARLGDS